MSNTDMMKENLAVAEDSEDLGDLQALETLDSLESKLNQVQVAYQQFYTTIGAEGVWKSALDGIRNYIDTLNSLPKAFGTIPTGAIAMVGNLVSLVKTLLLNLLADIANTWQNVMQTNINNAAQTASEGGKKTGINFIQQLVNEIRRGKGEVQSAMQDVMQNGAAKATDILNADSTKLAKEAVINAANGLSGNISTPGGVQSVFNSYIQQLKKAGATFNPGQEGIISNLTKGITDINSAQAAIAKVESMINQAGQAAEQNSSKFSRFWSLLGNKNSAVSRTLMGIAQSFTIIGSAIDKSTEAGQRFSGAITSLGGAIQTVTSAARGDILGVTMGIMNAINGISLFIVTEEEKLDILNEKAEDLTNKAKQTKADYKSLEEGIEKYKELEQTRYDSAEAAEEFQNVANELGEQFPMLIESIDSMGNATLTAAEMDDLLADSRQRSADATLKANEAELEALEQQQTVQKNRIKELTESLTSDNTDSNLMYQLEQLQAQMYQSSSSTRGRDALASALASTGVTGVSAANFTPKMIGQLQGPQANFINDYIDQITQEFDFENFVKDYDLGKIDSSPIADAIRKYYNELNNQLNADGFQPIIDNLNNLKEIDPIENQDEFIEQLRTIGDQIYALPSELQDKVSSLIGGDSDYAALFEAISELDSYEMQENALSQTIVSNWLNSSQAFGDAYKVVGESSELLNLMSHQILQDVVASGGNWKTYRDTSRQEMEDTVEAYDNFYQQLLNQGLYEDFIKDYSDQSSFSAADLESKYGQIEGYDQVRVAIQDSRKTALIISRNNILNGINDFNQQLEKINTGSTISDKNITDIRKSLNAQLFTNARDNITEDLAQFSATLRNAINSNLEAGLGDKAASIAQSGAELFRLLSGLNADVRASILESIQKNGISTFEGIKAVIDSISNSDNIDDETKNNLITNFTALQDNIVENLALSVQTALSNFGDDTKKAVQILSKARSGIGATEFDELIQQAQTLGVNLNINDFQREGTGGKAILKPERYNDLVKAFLNGIDGATAEFDALAQQYGQYFDSETDSVADFQNTLSSTFNEAELANESAKVGVSLESFKQNGTMNQEAWKNYYEAWYNALDKTLKDNEYLRLLLNLQREELELATDLQEGNYTKALGATEELTNEELKALANDTKVEKGSIRAQAKDSLNKGYSDLISDVLSKGFENINLSDYDGLTNENEIQTAINEAIESSDYTGFIEDYIDFTGKTIEEANAIRIQALEKESQSINVADALKDFKFDSAGIAYASTSTLEAIANALNQNVNDLYDAAVYNAELGGYQVKLDVLDDLIPDFDLITQNLIAAAQEKSKSETDISTVIADIIKSRDNISEENIAALGNILTLPYAEVENLLVSTSTDGLKQLNVGLLRDEIAKRNLQISDAVFYQIEQTIDSITSSITNILGSRSKGFTNTADMNAALNEVNKYLGEGKELDFNQMYQFDDALGAFTLTRQGLVAQIGALYAQLPNLTDAERQVQEALIGEAIEDVAKNINVTDFITAAGGSQSYTEFRDAVNDYLDVLNAVNSSNGIFINGIRQVSAQNIMDILRGGGENAVAMAEQLAEAAGEQLSADDVEAIYRGQVTRLTNAYEQLTAGEGDVIDGITNSILSQADYITHEIGSTGQYVVDSVGNLGEAYRLYMEQLIASGEATTEEINAAAVEYLSRQDNQAEAIDALGDAASMTYSRLNEILNAHGMDLLSTWQDMVDNGIAQSIGGDKLRIIDFSAFADMMGWAEGSEEYISAFKTYNDSMIELNRQVERNIVEEVQSLESANIGDQINLTQLYEALNKEFSGINANGVDFKFNAAESLATRLSLLGAQLEDGILTLGEDSNIPAIIQTIAQYGQQYGGLLQQDIVQLADVLDNVLNNFVQAISNGIAGKLSNEDAFNLQKMVDGLDMDVSVQFTKTADGLKITRNSAIELYQELEKIDKVKSQLVFDDLFDSMTSDLGSGANNMADTMATIAELTEKRNNIEQEISNLLMQERNYGLSEGDKERLSILREQSAELNNQISLYGEIANKQMSDPDSYDFMSGKLPDYLQGPANYWDSVGEAYKVMNEAASSGKMDLTDYYNIVNEMSNLAAMSGQLVVDGQEFASSAEMAAYLIEKGAGALSNVDGEGVQVDLSKLGINFVTGANNMESNFQEGVKAMARSQIEMLDAAIQVMETVVAMEKLGDVDVDSDGLLSLGEIFNIDEETGEILSWAENFHAFAEDLWTKLDPESDAYDENLRKSFDSVSIFSHTMTELIQAATGDLNEATDDLAKLGLTAEEYQTVFSGFYQALMSGDYNLENVSESVWEILEQTLPDGATIDAGDRTIVISRGTKYAIDWTSEDVSNVVKEIQEEDNVTEEEAKQQLAQSFAKEQSGKGISQIELKRVLQAKGIIEITEDNKISVNGQEYDTLKEALAAGKLAEAGYEVGKEDVTTTTGSNGVQMSTATVTKNVGKLTVKISSTNGGQLVYTADDGQEFKTEQEAINHMIEYKAQQRIEHGSGETVEEAQSVVRKEVEIPMNFEYKFTSENGGNTPDASLQQQINQWLRGVEGPDGLIQNAIDKAQSQRPNANGTYTVEIDGNTLEVKPAEGQSLESAVESSFIEMLDPTGMSTAIAAAITQAFSGGEIATALAGAIQSALTGGNGESNTTNGATQIGQQAATDLATGVTNGAPQILTTAITAGSNVSKGLAEGITSYGVLATIAATALGNKVISSLNEALGNASPSVKAQESGNNVQSGLAIGLGENSEASSAATTLGDVVIQALQTALSGVEWAFDLGTATANITDVTIGTITTSHYDAVLALTEDITNGTANVTNLSVSATNLAATGGLAALQGMDFSTTSQGLLTLQTRTNNISSKSFSNFGTLTTELSSATDQAALLWDYVSKFANQSFTVTLTETHTSGGSGGSSNGGRGSGGNSGGGSSGGSSGGTTVDASSISAAASVITGAVSSCSGALTGLGTNISTLSGIVGAFPNKSMVVNALATAMGKLPSVASRVSGLASAMGKIPSSASSRVSNLATAMNRIPTSKNINITATVSVSATGGTVQNQSPAKGSKISISNAKGTYNAVVTGRKTLMGELGPELVVTNGHYYVVGQNGPEMVNLADDAIVFNHKQTRDLLTKKRTATHGKPVTNEAKAISWATGNASGPAMASAAAALAALKQLRAMWQSLLDASARDLGAMAGRPSGGGGGGSPGGGGGGGEGETVTQKNVIEDIQRWYNLLRQIAKLEEQISYQESLQEKIQSDRIANGYALYDNYRKELDLLDEEIKRNERLAELQKSWYDNKRKELAESSYGLIFTYDEEGLQQYVDGQGRGLDILEHLSQRDVNGQATGAAKTAASQLEYLKSVGFDISDLIYNDDGTLAAKFNSKGQLVDAETGKVLTGQKLADAQTQMMENFWDNVDGWRDELDSLYDSYHDQQEKLIENQNKQNEILQKLIDNEISIEEDIEKAIEERQQAEIDLLNDQKEALQDATDKFIDGLSDQLDREKQMYENNKNDQELTKLQRQLAILQRSGGSASQIQSLQDQINSKQQENYFNKQQEQIDAIKEASDAQIERLDAQIDLLTETLEYQKENGLLWKEVREIMEQSTAEEVMNMLQEWNPEYRSKSELQLAEDLRDFKMRFELWAGQREDEEIDKMLDPLYSAQEQRFASAGLTTSLDAKTKAREAYKATYAETGSSEAAYAAAERTYNEAYEEAIQQKDKAEEEAKNTVKGKITTKKKKTTTLYDAPNGNKVKNGKKTVTIGTTKSQTKTYEVMEVNEDQTWARLKNPVGWVPIDTKKLTLSLYDTGGYTGAWGNSGKLAVLHEKELVLNKTDTQNLLEVIQQLHGNHSLVDTFKDNMVSSLKQNLEALYADILEQNRYALDAYRTIDRGDTIVIEEANVNMNVESIANDYDARRAGKAAFDEMIKIARKTGNASLSRR